jgi:hypothetical protein
MTGAEPESARKYPLNRLPSQVRILRAVTVLPVLRLLVHFLLPAGYDRGLTGDVAELKAWAIVLNLAMEDVSYVANGALLQNLRHDESACDQIPSSPISCATLSACRLGCPLKKSTQTEVSTITLIRVF